MWAFCFTKRRRRRFGTRKNTKLPKVGFWRILAISTSSTDMTCPRRLRPRILGLSRCLAVPDLLETMPDSSGVLFTVLRYTFVAPDWKRAQVWIKSLRSGERKLLLENAVDARYA